MSEINPFSLVDYLEEARSRVTDQFKDKVVFDKYIQLLLSPEIDLQLVLKDLMQNRSLDTAVGVQLDIIGDIVGQPRTLVDTVFLKYFAFTGYPEAQTFGEFGSDSTGGSWYSLGESLSGNTLLNDDQYRLFIKAKIIKNKTTASPDDLLNFIAFVFGSQINNVIAEGNASFTILVGKELNSFERALLTYTATGQDYPAYFVPKPTGVRINFGYFQSENYFGFEGAPGAKGFGEFTGTFGWGLGYGEGYGDSDFSQVGGGKFASLF